VTAELSWADIPSCKEAGVDVDYLMLRGIFAAPGIPKDAVDYYVEMFRKARETPEWKKFMTDGAFNTTFMSGAEFVKWVEKAEAAHAALMKQAGFLARK
jgi:tripartite-type tricarboxylate transporter receptor subunit TctC